MDSPNDQADVLVVHNPKANAVRMDTLRDVIGKHFGERRVDWLECSREDLAERLQPWLRRGVRLIIAAGGDGTVSDIASALPAGDAPLVGLLPLGTGNVLARELGLPLTLDAAAALLSGAHAVRNLDVLRVGERAYLLSVSVGFGAQAMKATHTQRKKLFGKSSYLVTMFMNFFSMRPVEYQVEVDGESMKLRASDLMASNCGIIGYRALRWWPAVQPDDGQMELCYLEAQTGFHYLWVVFNFLLKNHPRNEKLNYYTGQHSVVISEPRGVPVQGDGDWIGDTPVEIRFQPRALRMAVP